MADFNQNSNSGASAQQQRKSNDSEQKEGGTAGEKTVPVANKFDLGPRWSSEEIQLFFDTFKKSGKEWVTILNEFHMQGFTHRTKEHIKSLYSKHKTYLKLPSASSKDLIAIMTDYYKSLNLEKQRQMQQQLNNQQNQAPKEEFACSENIKQIKLPRRQSGLGVGRPGLSSSSEDQQMEEDKSSGEEQYIENFQRRFSGQGSAFIEPGRSTGGVFRPQIVKHQDTERNNSAQPLNQYNLNQQQRPFNKYEHFISRSAQNHQKYRSRQQYYHQFYPQGHRADRFQPPSSHQPNHDFYEGGQDHQLYDNGGEDIQMSTPSRNNRKKTLYPGLTQRRLFSQNASPNKAGGGQMFNQQRGISLFSGMYRGYPNLQQEPSKLSTRQKRQIKASQSINRRGLTEMNPYSMVSDDTEGFSKMPNNSQVKYSKLVHRWLKSEYFYSWIDRPYFLSHDFKQILASLELENSKFSSQEWSLVRKAFAGERGKPRRFSDRFIQEERDRLNTYRDIFREIIKSMQHKNFMPDANGDLSMLLYDKKPQFDEDKLKEVLLMIKEYQIAPLVVGQRVLAIHPKTKELRTASLLTTDVQSYHAQFDRPELGVIVVSDLHLIPISGSEYYQQNTGQNPNFQLNNLRNLYLYNKFQNMIQRVRENNQGQVVGSNSLANPFQANSMQIDEDDINFIPFDHTQFSKDNMNAMALLIILFERKNRLIQEIRSLNDQYQRNPQYTEDFRQKYAWTAIQLQATNSIMEPVLTMFRFRQIKPEFLSLYEHLNKDQGEINQDVVDKAQILIEDALIEVRKNFNFESPEFEDLLYQGLELINEEGDAEMQEEDEANGDYEQIPKIALISQEIFQALKCLQNYYNVIVPSAKTEDLEALQVRIFQKCNEQNDEQLQNIITSIRENLINQDQNIISSVIKTDIISQKLMGNIAESIQLLQEKIWKKQDSEQITIGALNN